MGTLDLVTVSVTQDDLGLIKHDDEVSLWKCVLPCSIRIISQGYESTISIISSHPLALLVIGMFYCREVLNGASELVKRLSANGRIYTHVSLSK